ncbi:MAG: DUF58 domain-containing protein [Planctomycetaceae bacterium]|nr:DUF58 domain-containing protein [Planctomycetaceae bacterium]
MMPRARLIGLSLTGLVPYAVAIWLPAMLQVGHLYLMLMVLVALVDWMRSVDLSRLEIDREARSVLSVGARNPVTIWLRSRGRRPLELELHDEPPSPGTWSGLPAQVVLPSDRKTGVLYHAIPSRRGKGTFGRIFLRASSPWGLWTVAHDRPLFREVRIYPDVQAVRQVELLARRNRLAEAGVRLSKLRGRGSDFDRLREYRRGDEYRVIDWKATARVQDLISREYSVERNQNLLLVLDAGRSMCNTADGVSHFDRAMNAAILTAYVALRQGDTVGLMISSSHMKRWVAPVRGRSGIERLISQVYDVEADYEATDYGLMAEDLRRRQRKRSLVVVLTHALDDVHAETIAQHLRRVRQPHLVLSAFVRNEVLAERARALPTTDLEAFQIAAASELVVAQARTLRRLREEGLLVVETPPGDLAPRLIARYLDIKARHLL